MKEEQKVMLGLLKEIDGMCEAQSIPYFLSPRLALNAYYNAGLPENPLFGTIFMKVPDMERFRRYAVKALPPGRALESMADSPHYAGFSLRYADTGTLMFHMNKGRNYRYPGIAVEICPLLSPKGDGEAYEKARFWGKGWQQTCDLYNEEFTPKEKLYAFRVRLLSLFGRRRVGKRIYKGLVNANGTAEKGGQYLVERDTLMKYPASLFEASRDIPLDGVMLKCPSDIRGYLKAHYGDDFAKRLATNYVPSWALVVSPYVSCEEFIQETDTAEVEELVWRRREGYLKDAKGRACKDVTDEAWEYMKFLEKGINLGEDYIAKKEYLKNLSARKDYLRLERAFSKYHAMTKEYLAKGKTYCPDEEIFRIYLDLLENTGKAGFAKKLSKTK